MAELFGTTQGILLVVFGLGVIIFIHELGHFIVSRYSGIRIEVFSIGFGPAIWKTKKGNTEYRISMIPLGGYVKPAGESNTAPDAKGLPDEFMSQPPLTRAKVYVAGAVMNLLIAIPLLILTYLIGINLISPVVGDIKPGSAEAASALQKGDKIIAMLTESPDGKTVEYPITSQNDYSREVVRLPMNTPVKFRVERDGQILDISIVSKGMAGLGVTPPYNIVSSVEPNSAAQAAGIKTNDEILAIDGKPILSETDVVSAISNKANQPLNFKIGSPNGEIKDVKVTPRYYYDMGIESSIPVVIKTVSKNSPAEKGGIKSKDRIIGIDDTPIESWDKLTGIIRASAGKELEFTVFRKHFFSADETVKMKILVAADSSGKGYIGIAPIFGNEIGEVKENTPLSNSGLTHGDLIIMAESKDKGGNVLKIKISSLLDLQEFANKTNGAPMQITVLKARPNDRKVGQASEKSLKEIITVTPAKTEKGNLGIELKYRTVKIRYPLLRAVKGGVKEAWDLVLFTYQVVAKLFKGQESAKGLAGPIGIIKVSYTMARTGFSNFLWLLALISINLGIVNLLPIPVMDGGAIVFCFIERIKGSPLSLKTQVIAQYVGLFIILALVVLTTFNDIINFIL